MRSVVLPAAVFAALVPSLLGQYYVASTVAGRGQLTFNSANGDAKTVPLVELRGATADAQGNVYFSDTDYDQVFRVTPEGIITVAAGNGSPGFSGDNGPAAQAQLNDPMGLAVDAAGSLFIADSGNRRIRKVTAGTITTVYGNGVLGTTGDGGPASAAAIGNLQALAFDSIGNLFLSQTNQNVVRRIALDGTITTVAGTGTAGFSGDGGPATQATLQRPAGLLVDGAGTLYIADAGNHRIRRVVAGTITTFAGTGTPNLGPDGLPATQTNLSGPDAVALDGAGDIVIADSAHGRVRKVNAQGFITPFAGGGNSTADGPGAQANNVSGYSLFNDGRGGLLYLERATRRVRRIALADQSISTVAGVLPAAGLGDNQPATSAYLLRPFGVVTTATGDFLVSDSVDNRVRKVSPAGIITTHAGTGIFGRTNGPVATQANMIGPYGLSFDATGNLLIAGSDGTLRQVTPAGAISTLSGSSLGFGGDGGSAANALYFSPQSAVADANGNIFITDANNHRVRRIDGATGIVTTIAGDGNPGYSGDGGPSTSATLSGPRQLAIAKDGSLLIADTGNHRIRRIANGVMSTFAGTGESGRDGDGGLAAAAQVGFPTGVAVDSTGNVFIAHASLIRKVDAATGTISRIAGASNGSSGFAGDGGLATNALFNFLEHVAVNPAGEVFVVDPGNRRIRKLTPQQIVTEGVLNAATQKGGGIAPGEIISIYPSNFGPETPVNLRVEPNGKVATELGGLQVFFDGKPAPLIYASSFLINLVAPYSISGTTEIQVVYNGTATNKIMMPVVPTSPGFFAITNQDGSVNTTGNRADRGSVLIFYGTGEGQTDPAGEDGAVALTVFPKPLAPVKVKIGGQDAEVLYAGAAPFFVSGVLQMNVRIPPGVTGTVDLEVMFGDASLPTGTKIHVK